MDFVGSEFQVYIYIHIILIEFGDPETLRRIR